eukprot:g2500.t1
MGYLPGYTEGPVWDTDAFDAIPLTAAGGDGGATDQQTVVLPDGTEDADTPNAGTEAAAEVIAPYWVAAPSLFSDRELLPLTHQHVESWVSGFTSGASSGFASAAGDVEVEEVLFEGATFEEQVAAVGTFDLLVGLQGAGMTNAIYRRRGTAVVLLFPLSDMDNVGIWDPLLPARGPYLRWFNRDAASSVVPDPTIDPYGDNPDTIVHLGELEAVVREALAQVVGAGGAEGTEGTDT